MKRPQNWKKSPTFWQNNCFYSVASEQEGDFFFKFLWPSQKNWTLPDPGDDDQHASRYVNGDEIVGKLPLENQVDGKAAVFPCIHKTWKKISNDQSIKSVSTPSYIILYIAYFRFSCDKLYTHMLHFGSFIYIVQVRDHWLDLALWRKLL